jgi:hypothetical protein
MSAGLGNGGRIGALRLPRLSVVSNSFWTALSVHHEGSSDKSRMTNANVTSARDLVGHFDAITLWLTCPNVDTEPQLSVARSTPGVSPGARIVDIRIHIASPHVTLDP